MDNPDKMLDTITDKFVESEHLLLAIKTPDRAVIENLILHAMGLNTGNDFGLEITGLHFDSVPVRTQHVEALAGTLETLSKVQIFTDPHSLQIA